MPLVPMIPALSSSYAHATTALLASCYVGSIYISKNTRTSIRKSPSSNQPGVADVARSRDHPDVIRARITAVSIATVLCCFIVFTLLNNGIRWGLASWPALYATTSYLGLWFNLTWTSLLPHLVTPVLYLGPLYAYYLGGYLPLQRRFSLRTDVQERLFSWQGIRNYFAGPITEEVVFRSCVLAVYHMSGMSRKKMIFLAPLSFGVAHVHHAWETWNTYGQTASAAKRAILMSLFQFAYTTLFGFHCSYLFLRTGSIYPSITAHMFCNFMGLPELTSEIRTYPRRKNAILLAYLLGIIGYIYTMGAWTRVNDSLFW